MGPFEVFLAIKIAELEIIPETTTAEEFRALMDTLTPEQRKKAKRKFRKLWRKDDKNMLALKSDNRPSKAIKRRRRATVFRSIHKDIKEKIKSIK